MRRVDAALTAHTEAGELSPKTVNNAPHDASPSR